MSNKPTRCKQAVFHQLCNLIPGRLVDRLALKHGVDRKARTFSPWSHVVALLYAQFVHAMSLHDVCDALLQHMGKLFSMRGACVPSKNAFSHANRNRNSEMAEDLFWETFHHLCSMNKGFGGKRARSMPRRFRRTVRVLDATTISLVANCMDWARHRSRKAAAKLHLSLNLQTFLPSFVVIDEARHHDSTRASALCANMKKGEIAIFDKAYIDFSFLFHLTGRDIFWVTRTKTNLQMRCVKKLTRKRDGNIISDKLMVLTGQGSSKKYPEYLRVVTALVEVNGEMREMAFMTNNMEWAASSICDLYKSRWAIEVFFKEIKQTLQLCDFLGHNKNAILWQVWTALLLYILVRFMEYIHSWTRGFKRLFCLLRSCVWDAKTIKSIIAICGTAGGIPSLNAAPQQAWIPGLEP